MQVEQMPFREPVRHGSLDFPLAVYRSHPNLHAEILFSHWHDEIELMLLTGGEATFQLDGASCRIKKGDMLVINSGVIHAGTSEAFRECAFIAVVFDPSLFAGMMDAEERHAYLDPLLSRHMALPVRLDTHNDAASSLATAIRTAAEDWLADASGSRAAMSAALLTLLAVSARQGWFVPRDGDRTGGEGLKCARIRHAMHYVQTHSHQSIDVEDMAARVHLSRFHFSRQFREVTGMTPLAYLTRCRMQTAETLLRDPDRRIMDIALDAGFGNASWFIACFRRIHGCTPAAFRSRMPDGGHSV